MSPALAHIAHWYHALLYLLPLVLVGAGLWWAGRGEDDEDDDAGVGAPGTTDPAPEA